MTQTSFEPGQSAHSRLLSRRRAGWHDTLPLEDLTVDRWKGILLLRLGCIVQRINRKSKGLLFTARTESVLVEASLSVKRNDLNPGLTSYITRALAYRKA